jgi:DNA-directed RNA polymerase subunit L
MSDRERRRLVEYDNPASYLRQQIGIETAGDAARALEALESKAREIAEDIEDIREACACIAIVWAGGRPVAKKAPG